MPIKGLSDRRRLPRAGIIKLGIKEKHPKTGNEYPIETDYFVCSEIVKKVYGPEPKELLIMFPVEEDEVFFPQFYKRYGNGILLCRGDGENAVSWNFDSGKFEGIKCPCEHLDKGACKPIGILQFLLPEVAEAIGVWQISTSSKNSIIDINSGISFVRGMTRGRIQLIPLLLKRELLETHRMEGTQLKKGKHYTLKLSMEGMTYGQLQQAAKVPTGEVFLPMPDESQPDDLCPPNGFKPENNIPEETVEMNKEIQEAKEQLNDLINEYVNMGGEISLETREKHKKFIKFEQFSAEIDRIQAAIDKKKAKKNKADSEQPKDLFEDK